MQEVYLDIDSKGIVPYDTEDKGAYVTRGTNLISFMLKPRLMEDFVLNVRKQFPRYSLQRGEISEKIYNFLEEKYECDLRWVPHFENDCLTKHSGMSQKVAVGNVFGGYLVPMVAIRKRFITKGILIHELIHSVRQTFHYAGEEGLVAAELFAESYHGFPLHDVLVERPSESLKIFFKMRSVRNRLFDCFEDKADYAFIRLKEEEIEYLVDCAVDNEGIEEYFKNRANLESNLRFEIMCEKLGL